jgi:hypothetical protein
VIAYDKILKNNKSIQNMINENFTSNDLIKHEFTKNVFHDSMCIEAELHVPGTLFQVNAKYTREAYQDEFYYISTGHKLAQLLSICQQMEYSILYLTSLRITPKMQGQGISKQTLLLYHIENYIIRTRSMYDRILQLVDCVFRLYNSSNLITHELIISNLFIKHSNIPSKLKEIKKIIKNYYQDRNVIIHQRGYLEEDIRKLEGFYVLLNDKYYSSKNILRHNADNLTRSIVKSKTTEYADVNNNVFAKVIELFNELHLTYLEQRRILEAVYGPLELLTVETRDL